MGDPELNKVFSKVLGEPAPGAPVSIATDFQADVNAQIQAEHAPGEPATTPGRKTSPKGRKNSTGGNVRASSRANGSRGSAASIGGARTKERANNDFIHWMSEQAIPSSFVVALVYLLLNYPDFSWWTIFLILGTGQGLAVLHTGISNFGELWRMVAGAPWAAVKALGQYNPLRSIPGGPAGAERPVAERGVAGPPVVESEHPETGLLLSLIAWLQDKTFQLGVIITILYSIFTLAHPSTSFLPIIPIALLTTATTLYLILGFVRHALATLSGDHLPSTVAGVVQPYNPNVPVSPLAFNILNVLSTFAALYVSLVVLFNIEVLLLLPLVLKQRAYSYLHKELGTPVVGPVFMTQMCRSAFKFLDDMFTPWTAARGVRNGIGGVVGEQVVAGTAQSEGFVVAVKWLLRMR